MHRFLFNLLRLGGGVAFIFSWQVEPVLAASITVTTTADTLDAAGNCPTVTLASLPGPDGQTSLREAVCAANNNPGADTITFAINGTFILTGAANEDNGSTGDLDIKQSLAINGNGMANTIIDGGGIERIFDVFPSAASTFDLSNMTLQNGDTRLTSFKEGGAVYLHINVTSTFNTIQVINNFSGANGAIEARGTLAISNSTISNNQTIPASGNVVGGGIHNAGTLSINNSTISNNTVRGEGGGIATATGVAVVVTITNTTISGNTASVTGGGNGNGGGISTTGNQGTINIINSTISGNHADNNGGGAYFVTPGGGTGNATLNNVTITNNTADNDNNGSGAGGGFVQNTAAVTLRNTIVAGNFNSITSVRDDISGAVIASSSYNLIGDSTGSTGITDVVNNNQVGSGAAPIDPLLGALANNTGPTLTHALLTGSPAINTANNATCAATDQRGVTRPTGGVCDIGSFEFNDPPVVINVTSSTANGTYGAGSVISITITFSEAVIVTGTPQLTLETGATDRVVNYVSGSGTNTLTFTYTVQAGDTSADLDYLATNALALNGGTIQNAAFVNATLTLPAPGAAGSLGANKAIVIDTTVPNTTILSTPTNPSASATATFTFTGTSAASYQCQLDGGGFAACTSPQTYTGLSEGSHTFAVRAISSGGTPDPTPASYTWVVDSTAPSAPVVITPANGSNTNDTTPLVSGVAEPNSTVTVFIDAAVAGTTTTNGAGDWAFTPAALGDGAHTVRARAADAVGNTSVDSNTNTFTVDATGPDTTITDNPTNPSSSADAEFKFTGSDGGTGVSGYQCQLDGGGFNACTSPQNYTGLSQGSHTFEVRAVDAAGNVDPTPASYTWVVDTAAPDTTIDSSPSATTNATNAAFLFSSPDIGVTFECQLDGGGFAACTSPQTYTGLSTGSHTFEVRAVDGAGNVDSSPASFTWVIDTGAITIINSGIVGNPGGDVIENGKSYTNHFNQFTVTFSEDANNPAGDTDVDDVTNPANYLLIQSGPNQLYNTTSCAAGLTSDDIQIPTGPVTYDNNGGSGPFVATITVNNGTPLPTGEYRLFVCGTTSVVDLVGNPLNGGLDSIVTFSITDPVTGGGGAKDKDEESIAASGWLIPVTGFAPQRITTLPSQTSFYASFSDLKLEIPSLKVSSTIVGVPTTESGWDIRWLGNSVGYLNGTAFPTWNGNSVLTAHVYDANGKPGPFVNLGKLTWGQQIIVHLDGQQYIYEVRSVNNLVNPNNISVITKHEELPWLTLITCRDYDEKTDSYRYRTVVRAVLVQINPEQ